jgi:hypothetical protein
MAGINVKVAMKKLVAALEAKVSENRKLIADQKKAKDTHDVEYAKWQAAVTKTAPKLAAASGAKPYVSVDKGQSWRHPGKVKVEIAYLIPEENVPESMTAPEYEVEHNVHELERQITEMSNAIRILNLSDEEYVNTTTYKSVSKYL